MPALLLVTWAVAQPALAVHLPTHGDVVLLDLNPPGQADFIPHWALLPTHPDPVVPKLGPPIPPNYPATIAGTFMTGEYVNFWDNVPRVYNPFHWETEFTNINPTPLTLQVFFYGNGCVLAGLLALPPGWGLYVDMPVWDNPPEQGWWVWGVSWNGKVPVAVDTSVTENLGRDTTPPCRYEWEFIPPDPEPPRPYDCWPYYPSFKIHRAKIVGGTTPIPVPIPGSYPVLEFHLVKGFHHAPWFLGPPG